MRRPESNKSAADWSSKPEEGSEGTPRRIRFPCSTEGLAGSARGTPGQVQAEPSLNHHRVHHEKPSPAERFWSHVEKTETCWLWKGATLRGGYGSCGKVGQRGTMVAHRRSWEEVNGPVPKGLFLDHTCRVRSCVRVDHLELVTNRENTLRGIGLSAENARKTHCHRGHEFAGLNLRVTPQGYRCCRTCARDHHREMRAKAKAFAPLTKRQAERAHPPQSSKVSTGQAVQP